jgi:hypothetical protein
MAPWVERFELELRLQLKRALRFSTTSAAAFGVCVSLVAPIRHLLAHGSVSPQASAAQLKGDQGSSVIARFERAQAGAGVEVLHGETRFPLSGSLRSVRIDETAELNSEGRLLRADVSLSYAGMPSPSAHECALVERLKLDAVSGLVSVLRVGGERETRTVPRDFRWIYLSLRLSGGARLATPTAVEVARRASRFGAPVRLVSDCRADETLMPDQLAVSDTNEEWLLLGDDLATFTRNASGRSELASLHISALGLELRAAPNG